MRRRYLNPTVAKALAIEIANATFAARDTDLWGTGSSVVASDSTHIGAVDQNIFTEWHARYRGRGVLIYWHVEQNSMAIHSQLISCSASEVTADTSEIVHSRLRKGSSQKGHDQFVRELIARFRRAGATGEILLRADSGFWSRTLIDTLTRLECSYSITVDDDIESAWLVKSRHQSWSAGGPGRQWSLRRTCGGIVTNFVGRCWPQCSWSASVNWSMCWSIC